MIYSFNFLSSFKSNIFDDNIYYVKYIVDIHIINCYSISIIIQNIDRFFIFPNSLKGENYE